MVKIGNDFSSTRKISSVYIQNGFLFSKSKETKIYERKKNNKREE